MFGFFDKYFELFTEVDFKDFVAFSVLFLDQNLLLQELHGPFSDTVTPLFELLILVLVQLGCQIPILFANVAEQLSVK